MGDKMVNPPRIEAICEFRFAADGKRNQVIPGRLYDPIQEDFPERKQADGISLPGRRLRAIRSRIESSGIPLLDRDGIQKEISIRRGGFGSPPDMPEKPMPD